MPAWFIKFIGWLGRKIGLVAMPFIKKQMTGRDYYEALKYVKPGMVFLTHVDGYLSNSFIPGFWKHAGIYCNHDGNTPCVIEATSDGVAETDLITFLMTKDVAAIFMPRFADFKTMKLAAHYARGLIGRPYDYEFQTDNEAFYCSEVIYYAYLKATNGTTPFKLRETMGQQTAIPQDIANAVKKWDKIWHSSSYLQEKQDADKA